MADLLKHALPDMVSMLLVKWYEHTHRNMLEKSDTHMLPFKVTQGQ